MTTISDKDQETPTSFWTKGKVAERLGVTVRTVERWMRQGALPFYKIGGSVRFSPTELDTALQRLRVGERLEMAGADQSATGGQAS